MVVNITGRAVRATWRQYGVTSSCGSRQTCGAVLRGMTAGPRQQSRRALPSATTTTTATTQQSALRGDRVHALLLPWRLIAGRAAATVSNKEMAACHSFPTTLHSTTGEAPGYANRAHGTVPSFVYFVPVNAALLVAGGCGTRLWLGAQCRVVLQQLVDEVHVREEHAPTAVPLQLQVI